MFCSALKIVCLHSPLTEESYFLARNCLFIIYLDFDLSLSNFHKFQRQPSKDLQGSLSENVCNAILFLKEERAQGT